MLLLWSEALPTVGNVAAIRFPSPVRIQALRIVPKGVSPFSNLPNHIGRTEPEHFSLRAFFNAQSIPTNEIPAPKITNSLVPVEIDYSGKLCEIVVGMTEFATRLLILQGGFTTLSIAVYGSLASEPFRLPTPPPIIEYMPVPLPAIAPRTIPFALNPLKASDPTGLARQLLSSSHPDLSLEHVIRESLTFNSTNSSQYPDLASCVEADVTDEDWLASAVLAARSPLMAYSPTDVDKFLERIQRSLAESTLVVEDKQYYYFELLVYLSSQPDYVVLSFLKTCGLGAHLGDRITEPNVLGRLFDAVSNPHVARAVRDDAAIRDALIAAETSTTNNRIIRDLARDILSRSNGWVHFTAALAIEDDADDSRENVAGAMSWLKGCIEDQAIFASFLLSLLSLAPTSPTPDGSRSLRTLADIAAGFAMKREDAHLDVIYWAKAYRGVAPVAVLLGWALNAQEHALSHRLLAIMKLWRNSEYREIVHILLSRYFLRGLLEASIESSDIPSDMLALVQDALRDDVPSQTTISTTPRYDSISNQNGPADPSNQASFIAMVDFIISVDTHANTFCQNDRVLGALRDGLAVFAELYQAGEGDDGAWDVMRAIWRHGSHVFLTKLVDIFMQTVDVLHQNMPLTPNTVVYLPDCRCLLDVVILTMKSIALLASNQPLPSGPRHRVVNAAITVFTSITRAHGPTSPYGRYSTSLQHLIPNFLGGFIHADHPMSHAQEILIDLLHYPFIQSPLSLTDIPSIINLFNRISSVMVAAPEHQVNMRRNWARSITNILPDFQALIDMLEAKDKADIIEHLADIDQGELGLAECVISTLTRQLHTSVEIFVNSPGLTEPRYTLLQYSIQNALTTLSHLAEPDSVVGTVWQDYQVAHPLASSLLILFDHEHHLLASTHLATALASNSPGFHPCLILPLSLIILRSARMQPLAVPVSVLLVYASTLPRESHEIAPPLKERICFELGFVLSQIVDNEDGVYQFDEPEQACEVIVSLLEWATSNSDDNLRLPGLKASSFQVLAEMAGLVLPQDRIAVLNNLQTHVEFLDQPPSFSEYTIIPDEFITTADVLQRLDDPTPPSTPPPRSATLTSDSIGSFANMMSPPILRSPTTATYLRKTYAANEFRQVRTSPTNNASRPPSTHVDVSMAP